MVPETFIRLMLRIIKFEGNLERLRLKQLKYSYLSIHQLLKTFVIYVIENFHSDVTISGSSCDSKDIYLRLKYYKYCYVIYNNILL